MNPARHRAVLFAASLILAGLIVAVYAPSLGAGFVRLDDYQYVIDNEIVRHPDFRGAVRFLTEVTRPSTVEGYYQPLTMLSLMLDAFLAGAPVADIDPFLFHLTNVLLHAGVSVLVFITLRTIIGGVRIPLLVALLFALHPVQVESVAWISQRKTLLASGLAVGSVLCYLRAGRPDAPIGRGARFAGFLRFAPTLLLYVLANLAKPTVVLLPLIFPLLDYWPLQRPIIATLRAKWVYLPFMLLFGWIAVVSQASVGDGGGLALARVDSLDLLARWIGLICYNLALYAGNIFWPVSLSPYRSLPADLSWNVPAIFSSILLVVVFLVVGIAARRRFPALFVGIAAAGVLLLPALGIGRFMASCVADRFLYLPLFFLLIPLAEALSGYAAHRPRRAAVSYTILLALLLPATTLARVQQRVWLDSRNLWTRVVAVAPELDQANEGLAAACLEEGDYDAALEYAERAYQIDPVNPHHLYLLCRARVCTGRADQALPLIDEALARELGDNAAAGHVARAQALAALRRHDEARAACRDAIAAGYKAAACYAETGDVALLIAHDFDAAADYYRRALEEDSDHVLARWNLGTALESLGRRAEALAQYEDVRLRHEAKGIPFPAELSAAIERLHAALRAAPETRDDVGKPTSQEPTR